MVIEFVYYLLHL